MLNLGQLLLVLYGESQESKNFVPNWLISRLVVVCSSSSGIGSRFSYDKITPSDINIASLACPTAVVPHARGAFLDPFLLQFWTLLRIL